MSSKTFNLRHRWERIRTVPGLGRDTAALAVLVVGAIITAAMLQSFLTTSWPWEERSVVKAEFAEVPGVDPQSSHAVTIAGVEVGKITDWKATDRGSAVLTMELEPGHTVYDNAHAVVRPKNPLNDMAVEIDPGGPPGKPLSGNEVLPVSQTERAIQAEEALRHLDERSQQALTDLLVESDVALARAPENLPVGLRETQGTLMGLEPVMRQLEARRDNIRELVTALSNLAAAVGDNDERLTRLVGSTQHTLRTLANNDDALRTSIAQLPGLSSELRSALSDTQRLTEQLNPTLDNLNAASDELPSALSRLNDTVGEIDSTVDAAAPFVAKAKPVVEDLRPLVADVDDALSDARPVTRGLDEDSRILTKYLEPISAFVYNTSSVFGAGDTPQTGIIRGHLVVPLPDGGVLPGGRGGYSPDPEASGVKGGK